MPSYSSVDTGTGPLKMHAHRELITDVLKGQLGFKGFVISDWQAIDQIPGDYRSDIRTSINAGIDMVMVPSDYPTFTTLLGEEVAAGTVPMARVDDAVARILRQKFALGLFEQPYADRTHLGEIGSDAHRAVARAAAAKSQVLLKNTRVLPLARSGRLYVAGSNADDIGNQAGGWTVSWQGSSGPIIPGTTILQGIREVAPGATVTYSRDASADTSGYDTGIVVVGETPYAEGVGDVGNGRADLALSAADRQAIDRVCAAMTCVVVVVSGRPMIIAPEQLARIDALVASWLPGSEGAGVADPLFGVKHYTGRLPMTWPRSMAQIPINVGDTVYNPLYGYGWGLRTDPARPRLKAARDALAALVSGDDLRQREDPDDKSIRRAVHELDLALQPAAWKADGSVRNPSWVMEHLYAATSELVRVDVPTAALDAIVSVARDITQTALVAKPAASKAAAAAALAALAERELLEGREHRAVSLLREAWLLVR
jgi:beta-glucosidase